MPTVVSRVPSCRRGPGWSPPRPAPRPRGGEHGTSPEPSGDGGAVVGDRELGGAGQSGPRGHARYDTLPPIVTSGEERTRDRRRGGPAGPRRRPAHRRRLRRGVRRGPAVVVGPPRRRPGRGAHVGPRPRAPASGWSRATRPATPTPPTSPSPGCGPRPRPRPPWPARPAAIGVDARSRCGRCDAPGPERRRAVLPADVPKRDRVELLQRADAAARSEGGSIRQVSGRIADSRRRILVANSDGLLATDDQVKTLFVVSAWPPGDTGMQTGSESVGHTIGFELFDRDRRRGAGPQGRPPGAHQADGPARADRHDAGRDRAGRRRRAVPRGVRPRPRGRPRRRRARRCSPAASASRWPHPSSRSSTTAPWPRSGAASPSTTRARRPQRNVLIEDGVLTDYMWDFLRCRRGRAAPVGQRPARDLPAPADGADDQHLPAGRRRRSRRHRGRRPSGAST